jgi:hypothetical protein
MLYAPRVDNLAHSMEDTYARAFIILAYKILIL